MLKLLNYSHFPANVIQYVVSQNHPRLEQINEFSILTQNGKEKYFAMLFMQILSCLFW